MTSKKSSEEHKHLEDVGLAGVEERHEPDSEQGVIDIHDEGHNKKLNRQLDMRVLPLCCWVYLLNFLDRGIVLQLFKHSQLY